MKILFGGVLCMLLATGVAVEVRAQTPARPLLPVQESACVKCHSNSQSWKGDDRRLYVDLGPLAEDVHWRGGVGCHDCHGGDPRSSNIDEAHRTDVPPGGEVAPFAASLGAVRSACAGCHHDQVLELRKSVHARAGEKNPDGSGTLLGCVKCHGETVHGMLPTTDSRSPVFLDHQVRVCGGCHEEGLQTYTATVHGRGLYQSGLLVTAVCADCHGAHGMFYAADRRSTLHVSRIAKTCGKCHEFIEERLRESVHGRGRGPGEDVPKGEIEPALEPATREELAGGGSGLPRQRNPSCTDCHLGHELLDPEGTAFRLGLSNRCGNCHPDLTGRYAMSTHGRLTRLGYAAAADCADCHGSHEIFPVADPRSPMASEENRLHVCRRCHVYAVANFTQFDPHANYKDAKNYPRLHLTYVGMEGLFYFFFAFFVIHGFLWFVRSFISAMVGGRHDTLVAGQYAIQRFEPAQRILYALLFVSFLGLLLTGLTLKYSGQTWAKSLAHGVGGFQTIAVWHLFFAFVSIVGCTIHLVRSAGKILQQRREKVPWKTIVFGPDSRVPNRKDLRDLIGMGRWFFGLGQRPSFERWSYWEKFDYWAVYLTAIVVGGSGLLLWYPNVFCRFLPGGVLNVAKVIHGKVAILAATFLFVFHFYNTHFRPEKFPLDLSALTGMVDEEHLREYRAEFIDRLRREGKLEQLRRPAPSRRHLLFVFLAGSAVFTIGLGLLALVVVATMGA